MAPTSTLQTVYSQPSWHIPGKLVDAYLTQLGGHLGPVTFTLGGKKVQPFAVAPWHGEETDPRLPNILKVLRGDFFCMPFGGNGTPYKRERHPIHGEVANNAWTLVENTATEGETLLHARMETAIRKGTVDKYIVTRNAETAVYQKHIISGASGPMSLGHHACLQFPDAPGSGLLSFSANTLRQAWLEPTETPENREAVGYSALRPKAMCKSLERVATVFREKTDLTRYPARRGYEDLFLIAASLMDEFSWSAAVFPKERYAFLSLKNPKTLAATLLWHSNGGRHYAPWNGRHVNVLGIEEVTSFFATGLAESVAPNALTKRDIVTHLELNSKRPTVINYIMALAELPANFDHVDTIEREKETITLVSRNGKRATTRVNLDFLFSSE